MQDVIRRDLVQNLSEDESCAACGDTGMVGDVWCAECERGALKKTAASVPPADEPFGFAAPIPRIFLRCVVELADLLPLLRVELERTAGHSFMMQYLQHMNARLGDEFNAGLVRKARESLQEGG